MNLLIYGKAGVGKTVFLGSVAEVPEMLPALLLDCEAGTMSIESKIAKTVDFKDEKLVLSPGLNRVKVTSWESLVLIVERLLDESTHKIQTVLVDSISELNYASLAYISDDEISLKDYQKSSRDMRKLIRIFRDMDANCILSALEAESKDALTGIISYQPSLTGKLTFEISAMMDIVGRLTSQNINGEIKRLVQFQPDEHVTAKDRSEGGKLGHMIENPTIKQVYDALNATKGGK